MFKVLRGWTNNEREREMLRRRKNVMGKNKLEEVSLTTVGIIKEFWHLNQNRVCSINKKEKVNAQCVIFMMKHYRPSSEETQQSYIVRCGCRRLTLEHQKHITVYHLQYNDVRRKSENVFAWL